MDLSNFGCIMDFAEKIETENEAFYNQAADHPACADQADLLAGLAKTAGKNINEAQRIRRENVTEMILECVSDFTSYSYEIDSAIQADHTADAIFAIARAVEVRAQRYYQDAAGKLNALPEVARNLKQLHKKHTRNLARLENIQRS